VDIVTISSDASLAERLDAASEGAVEPLDVCNRLAIGEQEKNDTALEAVHAAFLYLQQQDPDAGTNVFRPYIPLGEESYPPVPKDMPNETLALWERLADLVTQPTARARLHDLCFVAQRGNGRDHARAAAEAYLEVAKYYPSDSDDRLARMHAALGAKHSIARALELARRTGQGDLASRVIDEGLGHARHAVFEAGSGPGVVLGLLESLVRDRDCPQEVDELLVHARERYRGDVWDTMSTAELQLIRAGSDEGAREALRRDEVEACFDAAEKESPINAMLHLQQAAKLAMDWNLPDLRETAMSRLQGLAGADLGLVRHETKVSIPAGVVEQWFTQVTSEPTWQDAVVALLADGPPTGKTEANRQNTMETEPPWFS
jgi:catechol 2,3-dioxygenase-like lactoylglutathione lyase family enzyme